MLADGRVTLPTYINCGRVSQQSYKELFVARLPRFVALGQPQHIIQRGNNRSAIFGAEVDFQVFRDYLDEACECHGSAIHAYVFMTNHVHFIMTPSMQDGIGRVMQSVGRRYVQYFNRKYNRTGTLWEGRYRATLIDSERYLLTCYRYIELNPMRAGLVQHPGHYRWSSYRANALGQYDALITTAKQYLALGASAANRQAAYRELFQQAIDERTLADIREATNKAWVLGAEPDQARGLNRRARPLAKGGNRRLNRV